MNVHDSEKMSGIMEAEGYIRTHDYNDADVIIFNTCSIRQKAEQKFFSELGRLKPLKKRKPDIKIAVAGCIAQSAGRKILVRTPHVDLVIGTQNIHLLITALKKGEVAVITHDNPEITSVDIPAKRDDKVRAWINIMFGCDNFCSYCVVPHTRGRERSRAAASILDEIRGLAEKGYKEVTLLGQNVNSYESELDFPGLLRAANRINGIERIRFVTSHPKDLSDDLIAAMSDLPKVCEHIHLPLQSGSNKVLRLMNRKYTFEDYLGKIEKLRKAIPEISITSDIIAGFPQETLEDHKCTLHALDSIGFDGIFSFKFSPRPGTKAAELDGRLAENIQSERLYEIIELQNNITESKNTELSGSFQEVLIEGPDERFSDRLTSRTRTNKIVNIPFNSNIKAGDIITAKIVRANRHSLEGTIS